MRCTRASISIITAVIIPVLIGIAGVGIDLASIVYWRGKLQGAADAAALAAVFDLGRATEIAEMSLGVNGPSEATIDELDVGSYEDDPGVDKAARFVPGAADNAARVLVGFDTQVHFLKLFTGSPTVHLTASATAYNLPLAGVEVGGGLSDANIALMNTYLQSLAGTPLALTQAEMEALDKSPVSAFRLFEQIAVGLGSPQMAIEDVMNAEIGLADLANAAATALAAQSGSAPERAAAIAALQRIASGSYSASPVSVGEISAFYAHQKRSAADMVSPANDSLGVSGLAVLTGFLQAQPQNSLINYGPVISVPGLANISVQAVLAKPALVGGVSSNSAIGPEGTAVDSSQGRIVLNITLLNPIELNLGIINLSLGVNLPLIVDLGYGDVTVQSVSCGPDIENTTDVALSAQGALARLYVGNETVADLLNFATPLTPSPATIIDVPLVDVSAGGTVTLAPSGPEVLHFSREDIAQGVTRSTSGTSAIAASLTQLNQTLAITVNNAPLGTGGLLSTLVRAQLTPVFAALGPVIDTILASYGVRIGYMDVKATAVRCGIPALVT